MNPMLLWTLPSKSRPEADLAARVAVPDEVSRLRQELAAARIRIAALEDALVKWQQLHEGSVEAWRAALTQQRQALVAWRKCSQRL